MSTARSAGLTAGPGPPIAGSLRAGVPRAGAAIVAGRARFAAGWPLGAGVGPVASQFPGVQHPQREQPGRPGLGDQGGQARVADQRPVPGLPGQASQLGLGHCAG